MNPTVLSGLPSVLGVALAFAAVVGLLLLGGLLFLSPLMVWLNLRRLRVDLHADLAALRDSVDRLASSSSGAAEAASGAPDRLEPPDVPAPPEQDKIGFTCPECGKFFEGPASLAGTNYTCPECHVEFHIH